MLYLGTSGFAYDEWKDVFYPKDIKHRDMLSFYAAQFNSVEINYTFRRQPAPKTLATWRESTPDRFAFTLKAHQRITHWMRLSGTDETVSAFLDRARELGVAAIDVDAEKDVVGAVRGLTDGRGPDAVIDAVGIEAHGSPVTESMQKASGLLPDPIQAVFMQRLGVDRLSALHLAIELVRRGGTLSISGVYAGAIDPLPMLTLFDKQVTIRMGQANVRRWTDDLMPLLVDGDPLGVDRFASHHVGLDKAPQAYDAFQKKADGTFKVVFRP